LLRPAASRARPIGDHIGLKFGLAMLSAVLISLTLTAWRGYREVSPVAILLWSTVALLPRFYSPGNR
jgi:hypothetical protein